MATVTLQGTPSNTVGSLPEVGSKAPDFQLTAVDLSTNSLADFKGSRIVLNVFPSIDTGTCAQSVRTFNEKASSLENTKVINVSKDLPFAMSRFCGAEGLENVINLSDYKTGDFGNTYGLTFADGPLETLLSRCIIVIDDNGVVIHNEQVGEIVDEPNYAAALASLS